MGDIRFNTKYLGTNRGIIKILQIIAGFIIGSLLCYRWGHHCFGEGRLGYCSGVNFVILLVNIVFFILHFISVGVIRIEKLYSIIGAILFLVATVLIFWYIFEHNVWYNWIIAAAILITLIFALFVWDVKIMQGEASN